MRYCKLWFILKYYIVFLMHILIQMSMLLSCVEKYMVSMTTTLSVTPVMYDGTDNLHYFMQNLQSGPGERGTLRSRQCHGHHC